MSEHASDPIAELYAVPLNTFTRERNARAAAFKKAGRDAEAGAIERLRRPSASLWAINQLVRLDPTRLGAFLDAVDQARRTQLRDPRASGQALHRVRGELDALTTSAAERLRADGHSVTQATLRRIADTLMGAAAERRLAQDLRHGRLTSELVPPGFEILSGVETPPRDLRLVQGGKEQAPTPDQKRQEARRARREEERRQQREQAEQLAREASARAKAAAEAEREAAELAGRLAVARRRLREARRAATAAAAAGRKAGRAAKR